MMGEAYWHGYHPMRPHLHESSERSRIRRYEVVFGAGLATARQTQIGYLGRRYIVACANLRTSLLAADQHTGMVATALANVTSAVIESLRRRKSRYTRS